MDPQDPQGAGRIRFAATADVFPSIFRFNERRGHADFGVETLGRIERLFRRVALESRENLMFFEQRCRGGGGVIDERPPLEETRPGPADA